MRQDPVRLASWACRRYFRFIFFGAVSTCLIFNIALHSAYGVSIYCEEECLAQVLEQPLNSLSELGIEFIEKYYIDEPHPDSSYKNIQNVDNPPWLELGKWAGARKFINNYFKNYDHPGAFVEVGAQDGEFMSLTLWLEQRKHFTGLLIEPNPRDYKLLREKGRSAYSINACANPLIGHGKDTLWVRHVPDDLPPYLKKMQLGGNRLLSFVAEEDLEMGTKVEVQCFNLGAMIYAAFGSNSVDFLSISTHGGEVEILETIPDGFRIRCLAVTAPLATSQDLSRLESVTSNLGLVEVHASGNIRIFLPKSEVSVVRVKAKR